MYILLRTYAILFCAIAVLSTARAQTTTERRSGTVVYVSGNDLIVKMDDGQVEHFHVPGGSVFHVDGKDISVHDLKPGTHLSQTITTTETPRTVRTVRTIEGKVWNVNPPNSVILTGPDGTNKQYTIPEDTKFNINGQEATAFDLRKGMNVTATVVTDTPEVAVSKTNVVTGRAPKQVAVTPPPETPPVRGVLLIVTEPAPPPAPVTTAAAPPPAAPAPEQTPAPAPQPSQREELPHSATAMPLVGLLGLLTLTSGIALNICRRLGRRRNSEPL